MTIIKAADRRAAAEQLLARYTDLMSRDDAPRARDAARQLGVSEGELLAARVGKGVVRLKDDPEAILRTVEPLGEVMALTRNEACVHERKGVYEGPNFNRHGAMSIGLFNNPDIDLRLFMNHWAFAFAVTEQSKAGPRQSLQFFDRSGDAIHKIYMTNKSEIRAYQSLVDAFTSPDQEPFIVTEAYGASPVERADSEVDWEKFRSAWEGLKDTHDFHPMLRKFKVGREQAFRKIGSDFAYEVGNSGSRQLLDLARDRGCDIMVFVGNRGCIQIHSGPVNKLVEHGPWYNVLDPMFNLHLNEEGIARTWVTRKPTEDGIVTAVEVFGADGELIVTFFGKRKPGQPELDLWREIVSDLPAKDISDAA